MKVAIVLPVYNEEKILNTSIKTLSAFLKHTVRYDYEIIIADNGSTDRTLHIAQQLTMDCEHTSLLSLNKTGRGRILKEAWSRCNADIVSYIDADLSADLFVLLQLINCVVEGYDIAVGSRFINNSHRNRGLLRFAMSRVYNLLIKSILTAKFFSDAQCGLKAVRSTTARSLLPKIRNNNWFFDTELLCLAEKEKYRIKEVAVDWIETRPSKVNVLAAICDDLIGIIRLRWYFNKHYK